MFLKGEEGETGRKAKHHSDDDYILSEDEGDSEDEEFVDSELLSETDESAMDNALFSGELNGEGFGKDEFNFSDDEEEDDGEFRLSSHVHKIKGKKHRGKLAGE